MLDIVIPVFNEGRNILAVLSAIETKVKTPCRVLVCYDFEEDDTLAAIRSGYDGPLEIVFVRNPARGPHTAVRAGFAAGRSPYVVVYPADDAVNAVILDDMVALGEQNYAIVCASRFMPGGYMRGCPPLKAAIVRSSAAALHRLARVPTRDPSNGFRFFSRALLDRVEIESREGFTYSIELLAKCHRLGWPIAEVPASWSERTSGASRFRVIAWLPHYFRWFAYMFATTYGPARPIPPRPTETPSRLAPEAVA